MRVILRMLVPALGVALATPPAMIAASVAAFAQDQNAAPEQVKQIALTDKQIEALLAAEKEIDALLAKAPQNESAQPDPKVMGQLDALAKKHKFASYAEYENVAENVGLVMDGVDPQTKKYVGAEVMLKKQIAELQNDKTLSPKDKKEAMDGLNAQLKAVVPIQNQGNIDLVLKYYDKLAAAMPQNE
jgi:hypothetical protein